MLRFYSNKMISEMLLNYASVISSLIFMIFKYNQKEILNFSTFTKNYGLWIKIKTNPANIT